MGEEHNDPSEPSPVMFREMKTKRSLALSDVYFVRVRVRFLRGNELSVHIRKTRAAVF